MKLSCVTATNVGKTRDNNEDAFFTSLPGRLFAVADGIGGHAGGEIASRIAVSQLQDTAISGNSLEEAFRLAHAAILGYARRHRDLAGMGTTLTACRFGGDDRLTVAHAGDSAAFMLRQHAGAVGVNQFTTDQHHGHALDNCLGVAPEAFKGAQIVECTIRSGDIVVLCTDGLTLYADETAIGKAAVAGPFEGFADRLVQLALDGGGADNVTVVAVRVNDLR